jgi:hypothetical protein
MREFTCILPAAVLESCLVICNHAGFNPDEKSCHKFTMRVLRMGWWMTRLLKEKKQEGEEYETLGISDSGTDVICNICFERIWLRIRLVIGIDIRTLFATWSWPWGVAARDCCYPVRFDRQ